MPAKVFGLDFTNLDPLAGTETLTVRQADGTFRDVTTQGIGDLGSGASSLGWFDVTDYGAANNATALYDGVTTNTDATVTSATASWSAADIGKPILLRKSDNTAKQITTIASINSATSIELTAAATFTGTGVVLIYGTDDTAAIQDTINAIAAAGGGNLFSPGRNIIAGALQDPTRSNAQLLLPLLDYVDTKQITIGFYGAKSPPTIFSVVGDTPVPDQHSIWYCLLDSGAGGAVLGGWGPVGTLENFTNVHVVWRDLAVRMPPNPVLTALNFNAAASADVDRLAVDPGSYYVQGFVEPTTSTSYGLRMPKNNNGALSRIGTVNIAGMYNGYEFPEHCTGFETQAAWGCKQAYVFPTATNHACHFQRLMPVHCPRGIVVTGVNYATVEQYNIEHAASGWWAPVYDIDDSSNLWKGSARWHVVLAGTGVDTTFLVNGAQNVVYTRLESASAGMTTLAVAASDETTAITTGTAKVTFRNPFPTAFVVSSAKASLSTAQTSGSIFTVDVNEAGSSILSTKITIDNGEKTSTTAATPPVLSDRSIAADAEITIDVDQVGDGTAKGLKVYLLGYAT